ncbi:MAG: WG repeat-containing protein [Planctomycetota bacterium]
MFDSHRQLANAWLGLLLFLSPLVFGLVACGPARVITQQPAKTIEKPEIADSTDAFFPIKTNDHFYSLIDAAGTELVEKSRYSKCSQGSIHLTEVFGQFIGQNSVLMLSDEKWLFVTKGRAELLDPVCATSEVREVLHLGDSVFRVDCRKSVNKLGSFVFDPLGKWNATDIVPLLPFHEGYCVVESKGKQGIVDRQGQFVVSPTYDAARSFSDGRAAVKTGGLWGFVDETGEEVIAPQFAGVSPFENSIALAKRSGVKNLELIDASGQTIRHFEIDPDFNFEVLRGFQSGTRFFRGGQSKNGDALFGIVNSNGEVVLEPSLLYPGPAACFVDDHLIVQMIQPSKGGGVDIVQSRILDRSGSLGPLVKRAAWNPFSLGLACDRECKLGYVNLAGESVWTP